jgi:hypothetical protein
MPVMDKIANYRPQAIAADPQLEIAALDGSESGWPLWMKAWFFILSSLALWGGILLALFRIM